MIFFHFIKALPNAVQPSDHLMLSCDFSFHKGPTEYGGGGRMGKGARVGVGGRLGRR